MTKPVTRLFSYGICIPLLRPNSLSSSTEIYGPSGRQTLVSPWSCERRSRTIASKQARNRHKSSDHPLLSMLLVPTLFLRSFLRLHTDNHHGPVRSSYAIPTDSCTPHTSNGPTEERIELPCVFQTCGHMPTRSLPFSSRLVISYLKSVNEMKRQNAGMRHQKWYNQLREHVIEPSEVGRKEVCKNKNDAIDALTKASLSVHILPV
jgi:hypothetical protein